MSLSLTQYMFEHHHTKPFEIPDFDVRQHSEIYFFIQETEVVGSVEDDVIQDGDAHDIAGLPHLPGDIHIRRGGLQGTHGVIVGEDDSGGPVGKGTGEDFSGVGQGPVHEADRNDANIHDLIGAIDGGAEEVLLLSISVVPHVGDQIGGARYLYAFRFDASSDEFDRRENQGSLGVTYAIELKQIFRLDIETFLIDGRR